MGADSTTLQNATLATSDNVAFAPPASQPDTATAMCTSRTATTVHHRNS